MQKAYSLQSVEIIQQPYCLAKLFKQFPFLQEVDHVRAHTSVVHFIIIIVILYSLLGMDIRRWRTKREGPKALGCA